jgi:hypothetical protein
MTVPGLGAEGLAGDRLWEGKPALTPELRRSSRSCPPGCAQRMRDALAELLGADEPTQHGWLRVHGQGRVDDDAERVGELAFRAGFATGLDHVGRLVQRLADPSH